MRSLSLKSILFAVNSICFCRKKWAAFGGRFFETFVLLEILFKGEVFGFFGFGARAAVGAVLTEVD